MKLFCIKDLEITVPEVEDATIKGGFLPKTYHHFTINNIYETELHINIEVIISNHGLLFQYNIYKDYFISLKEHRNNILKKLGI